MVASDSTQGKVLPNGTNISFNLIFLVLEEWNIPSSFLCCLGYQAFPSRSILNYAWLLGFGEGKNNIPA